MRYLLILMVAITLLASRAGAEPPATAERPGAPRPRVVPIGVWLQSPANAGKYQAMGINLYVGLWAGPTEAQLAALEKARMPVVCAQNAEGLKARWNATIVGWLQDDEPDNAQALPGGKGYGPPVSPEKVLERYKALKAADPKNRPVVLNLGQGVAWDGWYGRGVRTNKPEDYAQYVAGGDIVGFDIYPVVHESKEVTGKLEFVGRGVARLVKLTGGKKDVWACIECTHISNPARKPTPEQVRAEVWMAFIHGARGIVYFAHQFKPKFIEAGVLADADMCMAIRNINREVQGLSEAIRAEEAKEGAKVTGEAPVAVSTRKVGGTLYVLTVGMSDKATEASISLPGWSGGEIEVIGEKRTIVAIKGAWQDQFQGYQVHLYRIGGRGSEEPGVGTPGLR